jgi:hypothetical protein
VLAELCRDVAFEAARRSPWVNPHELWAVLEQVNALGPQLIVDVWSDPAVVWAWWSTGARVVWVPDRPEANTGTQTVPSSVVIVSADPREASTVRRVMDQCAGRYPDAVVVGAQTEDSMRCLWRWFSPMARPEGVALVHGIAQPEGRRFWLGIRDDVDSVEYVGGDSPDGYGLVQMHGEDISHG